MRKIKFEFIDDDDEYVPEDISAIYFKEKYSDGTIILPQLIEIGEELTMQLTREMLLVPGLARCELAFIKYDQLPDIDPETGKIIGDYDLLTTQTFNIYIEESVGVGDKIVGKSVDDLIIIVLAGKQYAEDSEAWAVGKRGGVPVDSTDPAYNNNSLYWAETAKSWEEATREVSEGIDGKFVLHRAVTGADILAMDISTLGVGDAYPTLTSFETNSTFVRGAGETVPAGSLVYVIGDPKQWDYLTPSLLGINRTTYSSSEPIDPIIGDIWIG